ncbi:MAG: pentapeptide repeat-containing protein [Methanolinea sp.]|nr:pentapeptide repeat-containing protein [Methanolinea sp.]
MIRVDNTAELCDDPDNWNRWRLENPDIKPIIHRSYFRSFVSTGYDENGEFIKDFTNWGIFADGNQVVGESFARRVNRDQIVDGRKEEGAYLEGINLDSSYLKEIELLDANLHKASIQETNLRIANLYGADLSDAFIKNTDLTKADLRHVNFTNTKIIGCTLEFANLVDATIENSHFENCNIHGISAWNLKGKPNVQRNLRITKDDEPTVTVDDLEVAQFIYLLLNNEKVGQVLDALTLKIVLILGRFSDKQKDVLDSIKNELRRRDFTPIIFEYDKPVSKDKTGTIETLARLARFIIADLTDPSSVPHELATIVPFLRTTPVLPLKLTGTHGYTLFDDFCQYPWVLDVYNYNDKQSLISNLAEVINPAYEMSERLRRRE